MQPSHSQDPRMTDPERFDGSKSATRGFLNQCRLAFMMQPIRFPTDQAKVAFIVSLLKGAALDWASYYLEQGHPMLDSLDIFLVEFERIFGDPDRKTSAAQRLRKMEQGDRTTAEYAAEFQLLSRDVNWNDEALANCFFEGLSDDVKDVFAQMDQPETTVELVHRAIRIDNRLRERAASKSNNRRATPAKAFPSTNYATVDPNTGPTPMIIDAVRKPLTSEEREARRRLGQCFYCGDASHSIRDCPLMSKRRLGKCNVQSR